jgi:hypothetical protein
MVYSPFVFPHVSAFITNQSWVHFLE